MMPSMVFGCGFFSNFSASMVTITSGWLWPRIAYHRATCRRELLDLPSSLPAVIFENAKVNFKRRPRQCLSERIQFIMCLMDAA
jgi:hypothetical protein